MSEKPNSSLSDFEIARVSKPIFFGSGWRPFLIMRSATARALLMGIAKPNPVPMPKIAVLMPMTSPLELQSGPPLLPGLIAASVCNISVRLNAPPCSLSGTGMVRPVAETTPTVTVLVWPKGLPMAMAVSPICTSWVFFSGASFASGSDLLSSSTTAMSFLRSNPRTRPVYLRPSRVVT